MMQQRILKKFTIVLEIPGQGRDDRWKRWSNCSQVVKQTKENEKVA
jgi:hypothetical protein